MNASECQQASLPTEKNIRRTRYNAPGQQALTYHNGYNDTLRNMLERLSREAQLNKLTLDAYEDWSIALLHSWAVVLDVLAFYQARIINEGYLLTAKERQSVIELARAVGYEFQPALAATVDLVLTVSPDAEGQAQKVEIKAEDLQRQPLKIQSTPVENQQPQIFEIADPFVARSEWNNLLPATAVKSIQDSAADPAKQSEPPLIIYPNQNTIRLAGVRNDLQPDDTLLLIGDEPPSAQPPTAPPSPNEAKREPRWHLRKLKTINSEPLKDYTEISWHHQRYLFQLDAKFAGELDKDAQSDQVSLSEKLRNVFQDAGYPLAEKLKIDVIDAGSKWLLDEVEEAENPNRHYIVQYENQTLAVYEDIDRLTKALYQPQIFIFRQPAKLLTYAKAALYRAAIPAPPAKVPTTTQATTDDPKKQTAGTEPTSGVTQSGGAIDPVPTGSIAAAQTAAPLNQTKPSWSPVTIGLPRGEINALVANSRGVLFAATKQDVVRLEANATRWQSAATSLAQRNIISLMIDKNDALYAGSSTGGIYRSKDNGENWTPLTGDLIAPSATIKQTENTFDVELSGILPSAPVQTLATDEETLYALVDGKPYRSKDMEGTFWAAIPKCETQPPTAASADTTKDTTPPTPTTAAAAQTILQQFLSLGGLLATVLKAAKWTQWLGIDLWKFLNKSLRSQASDTQIQALAIVKEGSQSALLLGTAEGAFRLPSKISRWWVAALVIGLTILWNFMVGGATQSIPLALTAKGRMTVTSALTATQPLSTTATFASTSGALTISPTLAISEIVPAEAVVSGQINLTSQLSGTDVLTGSAILSARGIVTALGEESDWLTKSIQIASLGLLELKPAFSLSGTVQPVGMIEATGRLSITPNSLLTGMQIATATLSLSGNLEATSGGTDGQAEEPHWFTANWGKIATLVIGAIQQGISTIQSYWQALQDQLPDSFKNIVTWLYGTILQRPIQIVLAFLQTHLLQPLLYQTANLLARASLVTLALLLVGLGWQYVDRQMSNRATVKVGNSVHVLAVSPNGQVFAGSEVGISRSLPSNPQNSFLNRLERIFLRILFTDRQMESINEGLLPLNKGELPDVRALTFDATGNLLAGTKTGRLFRYSQHTGEAALFEMDLSDTSEFDQGKKTPELRKKFETAKKPLTQAAALAVEQKGSLWSVVDDGLFYLIRKEGKKLKVYFDYQWEEYDNGGLLAEVRAIVTTKDTLFVAGKAQEKQHEGQWFADHLEKAQLYLDKVYEELGKRVEQPGGTWLLMQSIKESTNETGNQSKVPSEVPPVLFLINDVTAPVSSEEFTQARLVSRATVKEISGKKPADRLANFRRDKCEVLLQSEPLTLYDNRPLSGNMIEFDRPVAGLYARQRLAISGKVMHMRVPKGRHGHGLKLKAEDERVEPKLLHPDQRLLVLRHSSQTASSDQPTTATAGALRWYKDADGFEGTIDDSESRLVWDLPTSEDPLISEIVTIKAIRSEGAMPTRIELQRPLQYFYDRSTVTLSANVVKATHGQSVRDEVLGNGTGRFANEQFDLPQKPLTFLQAATPTGYQSTLKVKVQGIEWRQTTSLYHPDSQPTNQKDEAKAVQSSAALNPTDRRDDAKAGQSSAALKSRDRDKRVYLLRQDEEQKSIVHFGDGKKGTRLPTGIEKVTAEYRIGSGPDGNVPANLINQPQTLPSAIPVVTNPLPAQGGKEPEPLEQARYKAPLQIRTLVQIVSSSDYEDFARQFAGIGRAQVSKDHLLNGRKVLLLTIADSDGNTVDDSAPLITNLKQAFEKHRVTRIPEVMVKGYKALYFNVEAHLLINPDASGRREQIMADVNNKIRQRYSFARCDFAQSVASSELIAIIHSVDGVMSVRELCLWRNEETKSENKSLVAERARLENGKFLPAGMLLINPLEVGVTLIEVADSLPSDKASALQGMSSIIQQEVA